MEQTNSIISFSDVNVNNLEEKDLLFRHLIGLTENFNVNISIGGDNLINPKLTITELEQKFTLLGESERRALMMRLHGLKNYKEKFVTDKPPRDFDKKIKELNLKIKEKTAGSVILGLNSLDILAFKLHLLLKVDLSSAARCKVILKNPKNKGGQSKIIKKDKYLEKFKQEFDNVANYVLCFRMGYFDFEELQSKIRDPLMAIAPQMYAAQPDENIINMSSNEILESILKKEDAKEVNEIITLIQLCVTSKHYIPLLLTIPRPSTADRSFVVFSSNVLNCILPELEKIFKLAIAISNLAGNPTALKSKIKLFELKLYGNNDFNITKLLDEIRDFLKSINTKCFSKDVFKSENVKKNIKGFIDLLSEFCNKSEKFMFTKVLEECDTLTMSQLLREFDRSIELVRSLGNELFTTLTNYVERLNRIQLSSVKIQSGFVSLIDIVMLHLRERIIKLKESEEAASIQEEIRHLQLDMGEVFSCILESSKEIKKDCKAEFGFMGHRSYKAYEKVNRIVDRTNAIQNALPKNSALGEHLLNMQNGIHIILQGCQLGGGALLLNTPISEKSDYTNNEGIDFLISLQLNLIESSMDFAAELNKKTQNLINRFKKLPAFKPHWESLKAYQKFLTYWIKKNQWLLENNFPNERVEDNPKKVKNQLEKTSIQFVKLMKEHKAIVDSFSIISDDLLPEGSDEALDWNSLLQQIDSVYNYLYCPSMPLIKFSYEAELMASPSVTVKNTAPRKRKKANALEVKPKPTQVQKTGLSSPEVTVLKDERKKEVIKETPIESIPIPCVPTEAIEKVSQIQNFCKRIQDLRFIPSNQSEEQKELENFKTEATANLLSSMHELEEILNREKGGGITSSEILRSQLMLATAIEQALKLLIASRDISTGRSHILMDDSHHQRLLSHHKIGELFGLFTASDKKAVQSLNKPERRFLDSLTLLIQNTSRKHGFICDEVTKKIHESNDLSISKRRLTELTDQDKIHVKKDLKAKNRDLKKWMENSANCGLGILIKLLNAFDKEMKVHSACPGDLGINALLKTCGSIFMRKVKQEDCPIEILKGLDKIKNDLKGIHQLRNNHKNQYVCRNVISIGSNESESQVYARKNLIAQSLSHLQSAVESLENLLLGSPKPSLCFTKSKTMMLQEAAICENVLLILLSHFPVKNRVEIRTERGEHFLFGKTTYGVKKHTHAIKEFLLKLMIYARQSNLSLLDDTLKKITGGARLELFIKQLYRYNLKGSEPIHHLLSDLQNLSRLRLLLKRTDLSEEDRRAIAGLVPKEKQENSEEALDRFINEFVSKEVSVPIAATVEQCAELVSLYRTTLEGESPIEEGS